MKNLILSAKLALACLIGHAQTSSVTTMKSSLGYASDTATNSTSTYVQITASAVYEQISIEAVVTKISGTVSATVLLSGSVDGTNFINLNTDTLTCTNQTTNKKMWVMTANKYLYYRLTALGTGTMAAQVKGYFFATGQGGAQHVVTNMKSSYGYTSDTVTNTATNYITLQVQSYYRYVTVQTVVTKISGTVAGTVTLQGSNDGTNYVTVSSDYTTAQTLTALNQATTTSFIVITGSPYAYYRLSHTGTGTMVSTLKGYVLSSK